jgi:sulfate transport system permease protein
MTGAAARTLRLPGRVPALAVTWLMLGAFVLLPMGWLFVRASASSWHDVAAQLGSARALAAMGLSVRCALAAALLDVLFGTLIAWVLGRYEFPGRTLLDAVVELPFALPTSVAGIALTYLWSEHGWFGAGLAAHGVKVAFTPVGIVLALTFVGLPFVVRAVQPIVAELDPQTEEAARLLGADRWQTLRRVLLPPLVPAMVSGFALALARGLGEYGSVLFISGNLPMRTEIAPLLVVTKLEQFDETGAALLSTALLAASLVLLVLVHLFERWTGRRFAGREERS